MKATLLRQRPSGEEYGFQWWWRIWFGIGTLMAFAILGAMLSLMAFLALEDWPIGMMIMLPLWLMMALWSGYILINWLTMFTPVAVGERGFYARVLVWWIEVRWKSVREMYYSWIPWAPRFVHVEERIPFRGLLGIFSLRWGTQPILLIPGLRHRKDLFWHIWDRASHAQGWEVPVGGAKPPGRRRIAMSDARRRVLSVQKVVAGLVVCGAVAFVTGLVTFLFSIELPDGVAFVVNLAPPLLFGLAMGGALFLAVMRARLRRRQ